RNHHHQHHLQQQQLQLQQQPFCTGGNLGDHHHHRCPPTDTAPTARRCGLHLQETRSREETEEGQRHRTENQPGGHNLHHCNAPWKQQQTTKAGTAFLTS
ncbi:hypothetical protein NFI96_027868, partial [Prochilodus magdalenae]